MEAPRKNAIYTAKEPSARIDGAATEYGTQRDQLFGMAGSRRAPRFLLDSRRIDGVTHVPLEDHAQGKLNDPRIVSGRHLAERRAQDVCIRLLELRMIENVEELGAEFRNQSLRNACGLGDGEIQIRASGTAERAPTY